MKTPARLALLLFAGLPLAGCATKTAQTKPEPATVAVREDRPEGVSMHFFMRDLEDKIESRLAGNGR